MGERLDTRNGIVLLARTTLIYCVTLCNTRGILRYILTYLRKIQCGFSAYLLSPSLKIDLYYSTTKPLACVNLFKEQLF